MFKSHVVYGGVPPTVHLYRLGPHCVPYPAYTLVNSMFAFFFERYNSTKIMMIEEFIGTFKFKLQVLVTRYQIEYSAVIIWHSLFQSFLPIFLTNPTRKIRWSPWWIEQVLVHKCGILSQVYCIIHGTNLISELGESITIPPIHRSHCGFNGCIFFRLFI